MHPTVLAHIRRTWSLSPFRSPRGLHRRSAGQAIVELTLALTFLAYLFAAAVDLGLAYKAYQTLINATAEASGSLKVAPIIGCENCSLEQRIAKADSQARERFRGEQGNSMGGIATTMDLDGNGTDDFKQFPNTQTGKDQWDAFMQGRVEIYPADQTQVTITNSEFAVGSSFQPSNIQACKDRHSVYYGGQLGTEVRQCFLVIKSRITYKPFAIAPFVGKEMTITAISVVPTLGMN